MLSYLHSIMPDAVMIGLGLIVLVAGLVWLDWYYGPDLESDNTHYPHYWDL